jgi:hypothetical protein
VHLAVRDQDSKIVPGSDRPLAFGGRPTTTIPAGAIVYSDPVSLTVAALSDLAIDVYLPLDTNRPSPLTMHAAALQTSYVSDTGNYAGAAEFPVVATTRSWFVLSRVEVLAGEGVGQSSRSEIRSPTARGRSPIRTTGGRTFSRRVWPTPAIDLRC